MRMIGLIVLCFIIECLSKLSPAIVFYISELLCQILHAFRPPCQIFFALFVDLCALHISTTGEVLVSFMSSRGFLFFCFVLVFFPPYTDNLSLVI